MKITNEKVNEILDLMKKMDAESYRDGNWRYDVYIDSDGDVDYESWLIGDNGWYKFRDGYTRYYVASFSAPYYHILWDYWFESYSDFKDAFKAKFGFELDKSLGRWSNDIGLANCKEHGISEDEYEDWLKEEEDKAIEYSISEQDPYHYEELFDEWIRNCEDVEVDG